jgi:hypothetical protein
MANTSTTATETKRLTLWMPPDEIRRTKAHAASIGQTVSEFARELFAVANQRFSIAADLKAKKVQR